MNKTKRTQDLQPPGLAQERPGLRMPREDCFPLHTFSFPTRPV